MKKNHHLTLISSCNEARNCTQTIDTIKNINTKVPAAFNICFIDENSPDRTSDLFQKNKNHVITNHLHLINFQHKKVHQLAYKEVFHFIFLCKNNNDSPMRYENYLETTSSKRI